MDNEYLSPPLGGWTFTPAPISNALGEKLMRKAMDELGARKMANARKRVADLMEADPRVERVMRNLADR